MLTLNDYKNKPGRIVRKMQHFGYAANRSLYWEWTNPKNFGDWIGPLIFEAKTGKKPIYSPVYRKVHPWGIFITAGSIMASITESEIAMVWGSGIMNSNENFKRPRKIFAVRGPFTRSRCISLGYKCPPCYGDPGILLPEFLKPSNENPIYKLGIIPHFVDFATAYELFLNNEDVLVIDVRQPVHQVVREIEKCKRTVSSSLHGLIVSHSYFRPSAWVNFGPTLAGDGVKFADYFAAAKISNLPTSTFIDKGASVEELIATAEQAPFPNNSTLMRNLLSECPF